MYRQRNPLRGLSGGIVLLGVALAFVFGGGGFSLPVFFIALAFSILIGSISSFNPRGVYGGLYGFFWMLILALFFITHSWIVFLIGAAISAILGALARPILVMLFGAGIFGAASMFNQQPQQPYYQPQQPYPPQEPYQPYQQGYQQSMQPPPGYQEGGQQYQYPPQYQQPAQPQYETPQAQYPQEMPPQQQ